MIHLEKGHCMDEAATTLHPCWEAYRLADKYADFHHISCSDVEVLCFMRIFVFVGGGLLSI